MNSGLAEKMADAIAFNYAKKRLSNIITQRKDAERAKNWKHCKEICTVPAWLTVAYDEVRQSALDELLKE